MPERPRGRIVPEKGGAIESTPPSAPSSAEVPESGGLFADIRSHGVFVTTIGGLVLLTALLASSSRDDRQNERLRLELEDQRARLAIFKQQEEAGERRLTNQILELQDKLRASDAALLQTQKALRQALGIEESVDRGTPAAESAKASPDLTAKLHQAVAAAATSIAHIQDDIWANEEAFLRAARELAADRLAVYNLKRSIASLQPRSAEGSEPPKTSADFLPPQAAQVAAELERRQSVAEARLPSTWPEGAEELGGLARRYARRQDQQQKMLKAIQDTLVATQAEIVSTQGAIGAARAEEAGLLRAAPPH